MFKINYSSLKLENGSIEFDEFLNILKSVESQNALESSSQNQQHHQNQNNNDHYNTNTSSNLVVDNQLNHATKITNQQLNNNYENDELSDVVNANMRFIFDLFDKDNDGKINKYELNFVMCNLFPDETITEEDIDEMLQIADLDKDGFIDFYGK